jgi:hypothetical protein
MLRRIESAVGVNLWTVQGIWFWSLIFRDRHGGAIGAAASEAEAMAEARATFEGISPVCSDWPLERCCERCGTEPFHYSKDSQSLLDSEI